MSTFLSRLPYTCKIGNCGRKAMYGYKNSGMIEYCQFHKKNLMVNKYHFICHFDDCEKNAVYQKDEKSKPSYCSEHKPNEYIKIKKEKKTYPLLSLNCNVTGCLKKAEYNFDSEKKPILCFDHKQENMRQFDLNICEQCDKRAKYNYNVFELFGGKRCYLHKNEKMKNMYKKMCSFQDCEKEGLYGYENDNNMYCTTHYITDMIIKKKDICKTIFCEKNIDSNKNEGYCSYCFINMFPEKSIDNKMKNTKELQTIMEIKNNFPNKNFVFNKSINNARPDIILKLDKHIIIIEIDENQHKNYNEKCEQNRINDLYENLGYKNIVLIRFNPDKYINSLKMTRESCFIIDNHGKYILDKKQIKEWNKRIKKLIEIIKNNIQFNFNDNEIFKQIFLFYDNYEDEELKKQYSKITDFL